MLPSQTCDHLGSSGPGGMVDGAGGLNQETQ